MDSVQTAIPEAWRKRLIREDGSERKLMVYQITIAFLLENREEAFKKIRDNLALMRDHSDRILIVFCPHENCEQLEQIDPGMYEQYLQIVNGFLEADFGIFDETRESEELAACFDAYYGDASVLAHQCRNAGVPVMIEAVTGE